MPMLQRLLHDPGLIFGLLLVINGLTVIAFWDDKRRAVAALRRTPESTLLWLAALGGTPGAFAARHVFRHKTRKQPFSTVLMVIAALQVAGIGWLAVTSLA
jgi:uncharacterized membrane protein YsdA (DUF1294 family)